MKAPKALFTGLLCLFLISLTQEAAAQEESYSYAYVSVSGKLFSKKLRVEVDLGDSPEQIAEGEKLTEVLNNKMSYAAVLNHMVDNQFELVETHALTATHQGNGGTSGVVFIMKRKN